MSSVPERQTGRLQSFPAGLSLPLQTLHTHPWHNPSPLTLFNTPHPALLWTTALTQNGLKMTLFSHFPFFHPLSWLLFSFHAGWKASQTPTPCTYHSGQDTQEVYVLRREAEGGQRGGKWRRKVGREGERERKCSVQREKWGNEGLGGKRRAKYKSCEAHEN